MRCLEGFFALAVELVKRLGLRLGTETGSVLTDDEQAAYCDTHYRYWSQELSLRFSS